MKKLFAIGFLLFTAISYATHTDGATNFDRIVTGSNNYGTDPNSSADITLSNDEYIDNATDGTIDLYATTVKCADDLYVTDNISNLDSIITAFVCKSTVKIMGAATLDEVIIADYVNLDDTLDAKVIIDTILKVVSTSSFGGNMTISDYIDCSDTLDVKHAICTTGVFVTLLKAERIDSLSTVYAKNDSVSIDKSLKVGDWLKVSGRSVFTNKAQCDSIDSLGYIWAKGDTLRIDQSLRVGSYCHIGGSGYIGSDLAILGDIDSLDTANLKRAVVRDEVYVPVIESLTNIYAGNDTVSIDKSLKVLDQLKVTGPATFSAKAILDTIDSLGYVYAKGDTIRIDQCLRIGDFARIGSNAYIGGDLTLLGDIDSLDTANLKRAVVRDEIYVPVIESLTNIYAGGDTVNIDQSLKVGGVVEINDVPVPVASDASGTASPKIYYGSLTNPAATTKFALPAAFTNNVFVFLQMRETSDDSTCIWTVDSTKATTKDSVFVHCDLLVPTSAADTCLIREKTCVGTGTLYWQAIAN